MISPIFILAGEASGDLLASRIMRAVNSYYGQHKWVGLGGDHMTAEGLSSVGEMHHLSLIGFGETIQNYNRLLRFADELVEHVMRHRPQLIMTIDAKGFSVRFAARLRRRMQRAGWTAPIIHTVAPTVWAWGMWRRHKFARVFDGLLCLFPFEPNYFVPLGLSSHFIGHPAAFDIHPRQVSKKPFNSVVSAPQIAILPGSRKSEIKYILPIMLSAVELLKDAFPKAVFTLPAAPKLHYQISGICAGKPVRIVDGNAKLAATLFNSDAVMATSGTVTLEAALYGAPGVVCYKAGWLSATFGRLFVDMKKVVLPNAILGREVYPFLFQERLTANGLSSTVRGILNDPQAKINARETAQKLRAKLVGEARQFDKLVVDALARWLGSVPPNIN